MVGNVVHCTVARHYSPAAPAPCRLGCVCVAGSPGGGGGVCRYEEDQEELLGEGASPLKLPRVMTLCASGGDVASGWVVSPALTPASQAASEAHTCPVLAKPVVQVST
jgi:hypothetical protein